MGETGICTLHTLHTPHRSVSADAKKDAFYPAHAAQRGRGGSGPERGCAVRLAPAFVQHADFNALYFTDSGF